MKIYIVNEIGYRYDDEYYQHPEHDEGLPRKAFRKRENAQAEAQRMNEEKRRDYPEMEDEEGSIRTFFNVFEVEIEDHADSCENRKRHIEEVKKDFLRGVNELFLENPHLESFAFAQYTDYWNDGSACNFNVHSAELDINGVEGVEITDGTEWDATLKCSVRVEEPCPEYLLHDPISNFLRSFNENDMLAMFGDHIKITVSRGGKIETNAYRHS